MFLCLLSFLFSPWLELGHSRNITSDGHADNYAEYHNDSHCYEWHYGNDTDNADEHFSNNNHNDGCTEHATIWLN